MEVENSRIIKIQILPSAFIQLIHLISTLELDGLRSHPIPRRQWIYVGKLLT